jgi:hypothetical protein
MDVTLARAPIESGKVDRLRDWYAELQDREDEVVETLRHEGTLTESAFVHSVDGEPYLYVYMEAEDVETAKAAGDEEAFRIDEEHHEVLAECLAGEWEEFEPIGHYTNPDR